ncbi:MAG: 3-dehydroquinate synthase [Micromonosporaceae bacterium]
MITQVDVAGEHPYPVLVGAGAVRQAPRLLPGGVRQVAVIHTAPVSPLAKQVAELLADAGMDPLPLEVPDAERAKTIAVAEDCWEALGRARFTRSDAVVGVGGGAVTDLAGFVAACWLRGTPVLHVATSLLGMVDAAVGGKTGVNTAAGKNLVGAFHPPAGVICDLDVLRGLPAAELVTGLAEVVKAGLIADPVILDLIEADPAAAANPASDVLRQLVERSVRVKADVVAADLRESALREVLNYGHTLAHAIERRESYTWRHGHAVSVGLAYAAALSRLAGRLGEADAARHRRVLESLGLPTRYPLPVQPGGAADRAVFDELVSAMRVDKKARGNRLRFVVLDRIGQPGILENPGPELLWRAYQEIVR